MRLAGPEDACQYWLHCVVAPRAAIAWDCRNLAAEATLNGFALGDFAASCLKRRDTGHYAHAWGVKLQEVLLDRMQLGTCTVMSMKLNDALEHWPGLHGEAQALANNLRRCAAELLGEAEPRRLDRWLDLPLY